MVVQCSLFYEAAVFARSSVFSIYFILFNFFKPLALMLLSKRMWAEEDPPSSADLLKVSIFFLQTLKIFILRTVCSVPLVKRFVADFSVQ